MTIDAAWELQKAVYGRIAGEAAVKALIGDPARLYDTTPVGVAYPFVVFADWRTEPVKGAAGALVHEFRLRTHARHQGRRETRALLGALYDALQDAELELDGFRLVSLRFVFSDLFLSADGATWNGVARYRAVTQAVAA